MEHFGIRVKCEKIKNLHSDFGMAVFINVIGLLLVVCFCDLKYEVSDDFVMSAVISGAYGKGNNPHLIFSNIVLGYILLPLYEIFPQISWYFVMHITVIFLSSVMTSYLLLEKLERMKAVMLLFFLILFFVNDMYILVQFTKTAMFAVMSGALFFLDALFYQKKSWRLIAGGALCMIGTWIRFYVIYMAGGFLLLILAYEGMQIYREVRDRKVLLKKLGRVVVSGCVLIGIAVGTEKTDQYLYEKDERYGFFMDYSKARGQIVDYTDYGYEAYASELSAIGVSENDYNMMKHWCFADNDVFTLEKMRQTADIIMAHNRRQWNGWEDLIERIQNRMITGYPVFLANIILVFLGAFLNGNKIWMGILSNGIGWIYILYFFIRDRLVYRTEFSVFLGIFLCGIYFWFRTEEKKESRLPAKRSYIVIMFLVLAMRGVVYLPDRTYQNVTAENKKEYIEDTFLESGNYDARKYRRVVNKIDAENGILKEIHQNKECFYFLDFSTTIQTLYYEWKPWRNVCSNEYGNYLYLAGITSNYPDAVEILEDKELESPLKALVEEDVYLIDNRNVELKIDYLREHYYPEAYAELYKTVDGYQIWKIYEKE